MDADIRISVDLCPDDLSAQRPPGARRPAPVGRHALVGRAGSFKLRKDNFKLNEGDSRRRGREPLGVSLG